MKASVQERPHWSSRNFGKLHMYKVMRFSSSFCTTRKMDIFCMFLIFAKQGENHF